MENIKLNKAMDKVEITYEQVIDIANDVVKEVIGDVDCMLSMAYENIENLTNDAIRDLMLKLSLRSYSFSEIKDKAAFKAELAETMRKEAYAIAFNAQEGTVAAKETNATIAISEDIVVEELYNLTAQLMKTRSDEIHRVVDTLKSVLSTRLTEAKLASVDTE